MADKEERIWLEFDIPKMEGVISATRYMTMTRQEAIDRIANAIEENLNGSSYKSLAEAVLNSLLGVEK